MTIIVLVVKGVVVVDCVVGTVVLSTCFIVVVVAVVLVVIGADGTVLLTVVSLVEMVELSPITANLASQGLTSNTASTSLALKQRIAGCLI